MYSLFDLEKHIQEQNYANKLIYVFYKDTTNCPWANEMLENKKSLYFLTNKYLKGFFELKKIFKTHNVNILHLHFTAPLVILLLLKIICSRVKLIAHFHNTLSEYQPDSILYRTKLKIKVFLCNRILNRACGASETVLLDLVKSGLNKRKCFYVDNGIDFSRLDINCENGKEICNIPHKKVLMIYGSHFYRKGVDIAIKAIENITEQYDITLMIVCQNKDFVLQEIRKICDSVPEWILLMPSQENIAYYLKMSDIYLAPSREEGFAYANLEAIYCGTPVLRSDIPAMNRKIPGDMVFPLNDISALRNGIITILNQTNKLKETILKEQKEYIVPRWNVGVWSKNILNMYWETLTKF
jgi:glycosyltransferase involved in cell wall biosynthesis